MTNPKLKTSWIHQPNSEFKSEFNTETEINQNNVWIVIAIALLQIWLVYKAYKTNREN